MERNEFARLAMALRTYYDKMLPNEQAIELWYRQLQDLDYMVCEAAIQKWVALNKWPPTIADIRETAFEIVLPAGDWVSAWDSVQRLISCRGMYAEIDDFKKLDDVTMKAVRAITWEKLCHSNDQEINRAHFKSIYEAEKKREREALIMPPRLQEITKKLLGKMEEQKNDSNCVNADGIAKAQNA